MTLNDGFDRTVSGWLDEQAGRGAPGYLDEVLARTVNTRQRPAWSSLERWLPMETTLRFAAAPRLAWLLVVLALLVAVAAAALLIGAPRTHPAPPFGPARNGPIVYGENGDILRLDPLTGIKAPILTGPDNDAAPYYSRNGLEIVWLRILDEKKDVVSVFVANADGTNARAVAGPLEKNNWFDWSPDGSRLALISTIEGSQRLTIANADGSGSKLLDLPVQPQFVSWVAPKGDKLLFRGVPLSGTGPVGLFTVRPDGTDFIQVTPKLGDYLGAYQSPVTSHDGTKVSYTSFDTTDGRSPDGGQPNIPWDGKLLRIHVLDLATGVDIVIPEGADPTNTTLPVMQAYGAFSPDGNWLVFERFRNDGSYDLGIAPVDGSAPGRQIGPSAPRDSDGDNSSSYEFTPDSTAIVATYPNESVIRLLLVDGGPATTLPIVGTNLPNMQRLAP